MKRIFLGVACMMVFGAASAQVKVPEQPKSVQTDPVPVDPDAPVARIAVEKKTNTGMIVGIVAGGLALAAAAGGGGGGGDKPSSP